MPASRIIAAVLAAAAVVVAVAVGITFAMPSQDSLAEPGKDYSYVYSGAKSSSIPFSLASQQDDSYCLFGSSELSTPPSLVPEVPAVVFGTTNYGVDLLCIGEAYDQSLWQAIAAGAYAPHLANNKIAIVVSPSWFFDGGVDNSIFQTRFSYSLYRAFCDNDKLSEETRAYVRTRLSEQGVSESTLGAANRQGPIGSINDFFFTWVDDIRLRRGLQEIVGYGFYPEEKPLAKPNFASIRDHALVDAEKRSTNEWGFDDDSYTENVGEHKDQIKGRLSNETFTNTPEYDDFGLFLRVCRESGLEPLVIVSPLSGGYYDWVGIDEATRRTSYDHILQICHAYDVAVADFSDREYEKYFLHDQVHFGWTGWVDVEQAIYDFVKGVADGR